MSEISPAMLLEVRAVFDKLDRDGSGDISARELAVFFREQGDAKSGSELRKTIEDLDRNGDGRIGFDEFLKAWSSWRGLPNG